MSRPFSVTYQFTNLSKCKCGRFFLVFFSSVSIALVLDRTIKLMTTEKTRIFTWWMLETSSFGLVNMVINRTHTIILLSPYRYYVILYLFRPSYNILNHNMAWFTSVMFYSKYNSNHNNKYICRYNVLNVFFIIFYTKRQTQSFDTEKKNSNCCQTIYLLYDL